jgi:hypothetical protein
MEMCFRQELHKVSDCVLRQTNPNQRTLVTRYLYAPPRRLEHCLEMNNELFIRNGWDESRRWRFVTRCICYLGRCPRLVSSGPLALTHWPKRDIKCIGRSPYSCGYLSSCEPLRVSAPTARPHTSLGQRPRKASPEIPEGQRPVPPWRR